MNFGLQKQKRCVQKSRQKLKMFYLEERKKKAKVVFWEENRLNFALL